MTNSESDSLVKETLKVAKNLKLQHPTLLQIMYVLENFEAKAEEDPTGNRVLWIEQLLEDAGVKKENFK